MVVKSQDYVVKQDTPIRLKVRIGDRQAGGTAVTLNGSPISLDPAGEAPIGELGQNLRGGVLVCLTVVKDINPDTNNTSVVHQLLGGEVDKDFSYAASVPADGATEIYMITYFLQ